MSKNHRLRFDCIQIIRHFFLHRQYTDVLTPPVVENPGMEVHLHPFSLYSVMKKKPVGGYLHTSPEFSMKELLQEGFDQIFTINYCFRDEPDSTHHRRQFLMLEWYRSTALLEDLIQETQELVDYCLGQLSELGHEVDLGLKQSSFVVRTIEELFVDYLQMSILDYLEAPQLKQWILENRPQYLVDATEDWPYEDYFFLLFLNEIEPQIRSFPKLIVKNYPAPLAALSTLHPGDPRICLRFELYINGLEIANCFQEECSPEVIQKRFLQQNSAKKTLYAYELNQANRFLDVMKGGLPPSSGIALGIERLAGVLTKTNPPFWD